MKSYRGAYRFENNEWTVGKHVLSHNVYEQLRRAVRVVKGIFYEENLSLNVKGVLVFINPESQLEIVDLVEEATLSYDQIVPWLVDLKKNRWSTAASVPHWKTVLGNYEVESYRTTRELDRNTIEQLKEGICCERCSQCGVEENWHTVTCPCGHIEVREKAYVRTICEYGILNHKKDMDKTGLKKFVSCSNDYYLKRVLKKHFNLVQAIGTYAVYHNKGTSYDYWFDNKEKEYFTKIDNRLNWKRSMK